MAYIRLPQYLYRAIFLERPNRFLVRARMGPKEVSAFLADPGRLKELLYPGQEIYLAPQTSSGRRTAFDVVLVRHGDVLVSVDSRLPNRLFAAALRAGEFAEFAGYTEIRPEVRVGHSRFDFLLEGKGKKPCYVEVKSVTLVIEGEALFPDAPTARGVRHLEELVGLRAQGYRAAAVFMIQREDATRFTANEDTDPHFAATLRKAASLGVEVWAYRCRVDLEGVGILGPVEVTFPGSSRDCV